MLLYKEISTFMTAGNNELPVIASLQISETDQNKPYHIKRRDRTLI